VAAGERLSGWLLGERTRVPPGPADYEILNVPSAVVLHGPQGEAADLIGRPMVRTNLPLSAGLAATVAAQRPL